MAFRTNFRRRLLSLLRPDVRVSRRETAWIGVSNLIEYTLVPFFQEELSPECRAVFEDFIESIQDTPSLAEHIWVPSRSPNCQPFTASINLSTLDKAFRLLDRHRVNRGLLGGAVTRMGGAVGVAFFNRVFLRPSTGRHPGRQREDLILLFHELYHAGQYYRGPLSVVRLIGEQIFQGGLGPLEKEAYAAAQALRKWIKRYNLDCWPLLRSVRDRSL